MKITADLKTPDRTMPVLFQTGKPLLLAGFRKRFTGETRGGIAELWQRFPSQDGEIPGQVGWTAYGLSFCSTRDGSFDYMCAVEVSEAFEPGPGWTHQRIPEQFYAVFAHRGHVSNLYRTIEAIGAEWLPNSRYKRVRGDVDQPDIIEKYTGDFNPRTGLGGMEILVPVARREPHE
jgi:AraC family transcriptional regulator